LKYAINLGDDGKALQGPCLSRISREQKRLTFFPLSGSLVLLATLGSTTTFFLGSFPVIIHHHANDTLQVTLRRRRTMFANRLCVIRL